MHVLNVDLNLLRVFHAVMQEQHITRASESLYLSQSAVSHAVSRLRHVLKDDLFIKVPGGVKPTSRAVELWPSIQQALHLLEEALNPVQFDPTTSNRTFRIACHDYFALLGIPKLQRLIQDEAPGVSLRFTHTMGRALAQLDEQHIDFAISAFGALPDRFEHQVLLEDDYVCLMDSTNPLVNKMSLKGFANARHLLVSPRGDEKGFVDDLLAKQGMTRHIALIVNQFSPVGDMIKGSSLVVTLPKHVAQLHKQQFGLHIEACPVTASENYIQTKLVWQKNFTSGPAYTWFRESIVKACKF
jgi:DNA-binding transcriptional LysR family regulator